MAQRHLDDSETLWVNSFRRFDDMDFLQNQLPVDFPYADSVASSNETESDEEGYISGLTHRLAFSSLLDDGFPELKVGSMAGSPQSTLCSFGSLSGRSLDSSDCGGGSPNGPSLVSSPPLTPPLGRTDDVRQLLYAAAGQVVRMKANDEGGMFQELSMLGWSNKTITVPVVETKTSKVVGHHLNRRFIENNRDYSALAAHFEHLKQQQQLRGKARQARSTEAHRPQSMAPAGWNGRSVRSGFVAPQNPSVDNGMRAIFLGTPGPKKQCAGTGVFLPRTGNGQPDGFRKKSGCSTVLLPARVVHALNLNIDQTSCQPSYYQGTLIPGHDIALQPQIHTRNAGLSSQRRIITPPQPPLPSSVLRLPQEWTY